MQDLILRSELRKENGPVPGKKITGVMAAKDNPFESSGVFATS